MARPSKKGFDYFPTDVNILYSSDIRTGISRFGCEFVGFHLFILTSVFEKGFYVEYDDDLMYMASDTLKIEVENAKAMLEFMFKRGMLDRDMFSEQNILTSAYIQENFQEIVKARASRRTVPVQEEYWLLSEELTKNVTVIHQDKGFGEINSTKQNKTESKNENEIISKQSETICQKNSADTGGAAAIEEDLYYYDFDEEVCIPKKRLAADMERVDSAYLQCTGNHLNQADRTAVIELFKKHCPVERIVNTITRVGQRQKGKNGTNATGINSFKYFIPAIYQPSTGPGDEIGFRRGSAEDPYMLHPDPPDPKTMILIENEMIIDALSGKEREDFIENLLKSCENA